MMPTLLQQRNEAEGRVVEQPPAERPSAETLCESCADAVTEEGPTAGMSAAEIIECAASTGADIADHDCDAREEGDGATCACACFVLRPAYTT